MTPEGVIKEISGYTTTALIYADADFWVYRASRNEDHKSVLIKTPASPHPSPAVIRRLQHEYEIARGLDPPLVARPLELKRLSGPLALVLDAGEVESLASQAPAPVGRFLKTATKIVEALFHRAECGFPTGDTAAAEERLSMLSGRAGNPVNRATVAGLRMVLRVIHRHGGRVRAEGERGHGAAFFFTLPEGEDES